MVYYDIKQSQYIISRGKLTFYFSSIYNLNRFKDKEVDYIIEVSNSLSNRFKFNIVAEDIARVSLYRKVEKRGFYILKDGKELRCLQA